MKRRLFLLACALFPVMARASENYLTASEIETLLRSKRIAGDWNGTPYEQSFDGSGMTVYMPAGGRRDAGRWRVNADTNSYESWWERSGWSCYRIVRDNGSLYWVDGAGDRYPVEVSAE